MSIKVGQIYEIALSCDVETQRVNKWFSGGILRVKDVEDSWVSFTYEHYGKFTGMRDGMKLFHFKSLVDDYCLKRVNEDVLSHALKHDKSWISHKD